eukprot:364100-Chlamydomonas_euryale.AAC.25
MPEGTAYGSAADAPSAPAPRQITVFPQRSSLKERIVHSSWKGVLTGVTAGISVGGWSRSVARQAIRTVCPPNDGMPANNMHAYHAFRRVRQLCFNTNMGIQNPREKLMF